MELTERLYKAALFRLKRKDYSRLEMKRSLERKLMRDRNPETAAKLPSSQQAIQATVERLFDEGWLQEERYAEALVRGQIARKKGMTAIEWKLRSKGLEVPKERIRALIDESTGAESGEGSHTLALQVLRRKYPGAVNDFKEAQKALAALLRRGFSYAEAKSALEALKREVQDLEPGF